MHVQMIRVRVPHLQLLVLNPAVFPAVDDDLHPGFHIRQHGRRARGLREASRSQSSLHRGRRHGTDLACRPAQGPQAAEEGIDAHWSGLIWPNIWPAQGGAQNSLAFTRAGYMALLTLAGLLKVRKQQKKESMLTAAA